MVRAVSRQFVVAAATTLLIAAACRDAQGPDPQASLLPGFAGRRGDRRYDDHDRLSGRSRRLHRSPWTTARVSTLRRLEP